MPVLALRALVASGEATDDDRALLAQLSGDLSCDDALADAVAALREHRVVEQTHARSAALCREAVDLLAGLPAGPATDALVAFAQVLVDRTA